MICKFSAALSNSKIFMREYEIPSEFTLYRFHEYIQNELGFSPDQMVLMRGCDKKGKVKGEYGLFDMGDGTMDMKSIDDLLKKKEVIIEYVFDLFKNRYITLTFMGEVEPQPKITYPRLTAEKGRNPEQFLKGEDNYDALESTEIAPAVKSSSKRAANDDFDNDEDFDDEDTDKDEDGEEIFDEDEFDEMNKND